MPFFNLIRVWISVQFGELNALKPVFARNKSLYPNQHFLNHGSICISFERMTLKWGFDAGCGTDVSSWCLTDVGKIIFIPAFAKIAGNILFGMYIFFITAMWHSAVTFLHFSPHRYHFLSLVLMNGKQMKQETRPREFFSFFGLFNKTKWALLPCFVLL